MARLGNILYKGIWLSSHATCIVPLLVTIPHSSVLIRKIYNLPDQKAKQIVMYANFAKHHYEQFDKINTLNLA